jgi:hypothetical protein
MFQIWLGLPHPSIASIPQCMCTHPIDLMGIDLLCCVHGNKRTWTHDVVRDTFATIVWDVGFHVGWKHLHAFLSNMFNSFRWQVNIVLTKDDIHTLIDIVIANLTQMDLLFWSCTTQGFVAYNAFQTKEQSYYDLHPTNQFLPLPMEVFGCLHKHANAFLHNCANAIQSLKRPNGFPFFCISYFSSVKKFNHMAISILHLKLSGNHRLNYFPISTPSKHISHLHDQLIASGQFLIWKNMIDLLQAVNFWHE